MAILVRQHFYLSLTDRQSIISIPGHLLDQTPRLFTMHALHSCDSSPHTLVTSMKNMVTFHSREQRLNGSILTSGAYPFPGISRGALSLHTLHLMRPGLHCASEW